MNKEFKFGANLDYNDIDLTAPDKVIEDILSQLPRVTNGVIWGKILPYSGQVLSYTNVNLLNLTEAFSAVEVDIQKNLGAIGQEIHKFECFLYTPEYEKYKYRVFFVKYEIAKYPVDIILDESVARSLSDSKAGYIRSCATREELENLIYNVFNTRRLLTVMQELIRINQAKRNERIGSEATDFDETETNNDLGENV